MAMQEGLLTRGTSVLHTPRNTLFITNTISSSEKITPDPVTAHSFLEIFRVFQCDSTLTLIPRFFGSGQPFRHGRYSSRVLSKSAIISFPCNHAYRRMSRQPLRDRVPCCFLKLLHPLPDFHRFIRVVTTPRHHHQPNVISLAFLSS